MNKEILRLAVPNILTNLTVPLVSLVDTALVGRMPSASFIIAIGLGTVIFNFIYWGFGFLRMGTTGMVAQGIGREDRNAIISVLTKGLFVAVAGGLLLVIFKNSIFDLVQLVMQPDSMVVSPLKEYFEIRIYAAPSTIAVYVVTGWLLGMQDARGALFLAVIINLFNVCLSYLLVQYFNLSIQGIAYGTLAAQYLGLMTAFGLLYFRHNITIGNLFSSWESRDWKDFLSTNGNIFIRTLLLIAVMSFFKTKASNLDLLTGAANILLLEFIALSAYGIDGFAFAAESICGKYFGIGEKSSFYKAVKLVFAWGVLLGFVFSMVFWLFGSEILHFMTNKPRVIIRAMEFLPWLILAPVVNSFAFIWDGVYIGATASKAMRNTMLWAVLFVFFPLFFIFQDLYGNHGIWLAFTLFMFARGLLQSLLAKNAVFRHLR